MLLLEFGIGYLAVLSLAAVWAIVERTRSAVAERGALRDQALLEGAPPQLSQALEASDTAVPLGAPAIAVSVDVA